MLWHKLQGAGGAAEIDPVSFVSESSLVEASDATRSLTVSGLTPGDMVIAVTANRTTTPPLTPSGWSSVLTGSTTTAGGSRSFRIQSAFVASGSTKSIIAVCSYIAMIAVRNASSIGVKSTFSDGSIVSTLTIPNLAGLDISGKSFLYAGTYVPTFYSSVTSPWSLLSNAGAYITGNTSSSVVSDTFTLSTSVAALSFAIEILP